ncbi:hypothetical protein ES288_D03G120400v1 [Gossypium darwinii]|uniref:Endonuclease/exonuclease/phosphatase domain-containing protein n=1 Tax=Gossypium darwinii TaxID=34276 RepID=A0A5D2D3J8_GOSDA|nr:hypothetical protein ES288_D03G120400v1 [Gossypium darwinii]
MILRLHLFLSLELVLGFDCSHIIKARGLFGGLWVCWKKSAQVHVINNDPQFKLFVTFVYGSPDKRLRSFLWERLDHLAHSIKDPWVLLGDFNSFLFPD